MKPDERLPADILRKISEARAAGSKIVFTNGCFDLLHGGHLKTLKEASKEGDFLIVGLNDDDSVRRIKGEKRPILPLEERKVLLEAFSIVGLVIPFGEDTPARLIRQIRPDVIVKGGDYREEDVIGADHVAGWGGSVVIVPLAEGKSTSEIIRRIRESGAGKEKRKLS